MELPAPAFLVAGAVLAALLTGLFNLTNLIISKEDKVSDFRQRWLDSLREETSRLLAVIETLVRLVEPRVADKPEGLSSPELSEFRGEHWQQYRDLNEMRFRVSLRLNPAEHKSLDSTLSDLTAAFYGPCNNLPDIRRLQNNVVQETQRIIKETWERVKQGEKMFRRMRKGLMVVVLVLAAVLALTVLAFLQQRHLSFGQRDQVTTQQPAEPRKEGAKEPAPAQRPGVPAEEKSRQK
jgi:hypothetical protein